MNHGVGAADQLCDTNDPGSVSPPVSFSEWQDEPTGLVAQAVTRLGVTVPPPRPHRAVYDTYTATLQHAPPPPLTHSR